MSSIKPRDSKASSQGRGSKVSESSNGYSTRNLRSVNEEEYSTPLPISGFITPYVNSSKWADTGRITDYGDPDTTKEKRPGETFAETDLYGIFSNSADPYPSWSSSKNLPISREEIEAIFIQLTEVFGFQYDSSKNMFDYFLKLLDSRASRMSPVKALRSIHADYIGGFNSNFKKWYFAAQMDIDDATRYDSAKQGKPLNSKEKSHLLSSTESQWFENMSQLTPTDCAIQVSLYLLCWGEANIVRFMPECLCFIFKCCNDAYYALDINNPISNISPSFLDHAITPLYQFYHDQSFERNGTEIHRNDKDHDEIIGYDDMNQLFWYGEGLKRLVLQDKKTKLMSLPPSERYQNLQNVLWKKAFYKTFREKRTWTHVFANFNRIWIIHISVFWYYTTFHSPSLYTKNYRILANNQPTRQAQLTIMSLAGPIAILICLLSTYFEFTFVPRKWTGAQPLFKRFILLLILFSVTISPTLYLLGFYPLDSSTKLGLGIASTQFALSLLVVTYLSVVPLGRVFASYLAAKNDRKYLPTYSFAASFYKLNGSNRNASYGLWVVIFASKFVESYFYLTLSLRDSIRELSAINITRCSGDLWIGKWLCSHQPAIVLVLVVFTDLVLCFLDTYLWYIVWNTIFSVFRSFSIGVSVWTPWRNIFSRLPKRIYSKILANPGNKNIKSKILVSQVWNSIIVSMYREHLLSLDQVQKLIYKQVTSDTDDEPKLKEPLFFVSQEDEWMKSGLFHKKSEAQRRVTFFAQSLSTPMQDVCPISNMPSFTVLIPHYNEKITLSLKDIIREEDKYSNVTMLEYLKSLHPSEWTNFVKDTKQLAEEYNSTTNSPDDKVKEKEDDFSYYSVGYKIATPEYILRTRIWASLRSQTLYRTISGFMNYSRAIKLLYDVESPDKNDSEKDENDEARRLEEASIVALQKFRIIASMQRVKSFTEEENEDKNFLLRAYPELQICYLDEELDPESGEKTYYSVLIDGSCPIFENGERKPKYKIRLSGNPVLGDGKSDNQNHAVIFSRGEYLQLVDANQDNYLEECLKIRSVLAEFEEGTFPLESYSDITDTEYASPVAIIGTREYIFSENIGVLGDVAAGKEQTFGTLFARTLTHIGGKLHYGHPDFLNATFMLTRGGVSKAQKGLHLNEDIYAGMNAILRGGRIKHCEYMQCGKGRDLGFGSILNFTTKIGAGMGEQMLSREYFYMSTQLPLDRFLSFYYAHPGFHMNNVFIVLSIKMFLLVAINLAALTNDSIICEYDRFRPITDPRRPVGCYNLIPVVQWLERSVLSIFIVFFISFVPLAVQELSERGFSKALTRLTKHIASLSPLFEVFVCKIYSQSLVSDIAVGGARYIATGRGFATTRIPFADLYSRFAAESLYYGAGCGILILYCTIAMWRFPLIYFWITILGLLLCPFIYNPNQFVWGEFFVDYKHYLKWLHEGNSQSRKSSWIGFAKLRRTRIVGAKKKRQGSSDEIKVISDLKPSRVHLLLHELVIELFVIGAIWSAYSFTNSQNEIRNSLPTNSILRIIIVALGPIIVNMLVLILFFIISVLIGPVFAFFHKLPAIFAAIVRVIAVINYVFFFELLWFFQRWDFARTILGMGLVIMIQCWILKVFTILFVSKELRHDRTNKTWWSGKWVTSGLGWYVFTQPARELVCKTAELSHFVGDLVLGHIILFAQIPILLVPYADKWHSLMLYWLKPGNQIRPRLLTKREQRRRRVTVALYMLVFLISMCLFSCIFVAPTVIKALGVDLEDYIPTKFGDLIQPYAPFNARKGLHKSLIIKH